MKLLQHAYDDTKRMVQRGSALIGVMGIALLFVTVAVVQQTTRLHQLEKGIKENVMLSKRYDSEPVVKTMIEIVPGTVYTRWGRNTCPYKLSKLVYNGTVGGQFFKHSGGGSNILCLPTDPTWGNYTTASEPSQYIYGGEYEINHYNRYSKTGLFSNANSKVLHDRNVPCAVCQTLTPATVMMLPARKNCYPGWTLEYTGYLMSSHYGHSGRTPFTCVDIAPEADPAGYGNENGILFYNVQGACGSLPCPPYVDGQELTCAVCSQRHTFAFVNKTQG